MGFWGRLQFREKEIQPKDSKEVYKKGFYKPSEVIKEVNNSIK
jgi:hypothetical protein